ncbi:MAG TPA: hypothetical protein VEK15_27815 [Vicinamibacteria bacterium]|nr:hypothetical protein [Vicinamibacteria bacterium]
MEVMHGRPSRRILERAGRRRTPLPLILALAALAALFLGSQKPQPCDDAYITFRHVRHLVTDHQPIWNLGGPPVLGSTSPAWIVLLGIVSSVVGLESLPWTALLLNSVLLAGIVVLAYLVVADLTERSLPAVLAAVLVGINSVNVFVFSQGFESALLTLMLLGGVYAVRIRRDVSAVAAASLAPLIRPEGLLLTPLVWGTIVVSRRARVKLVAVYAVAPIVWVCFANWQYGSAVPHPILAKRYFPAIYYPYDAHQVDLEGRLSKVPLHAVDLWNHDASSYLFNGYRFARHSRWIRVSPLRWSLLGAAIFPILLVKKDERLVYFLYAPCFLLLYGWVGRTEVWYFPSFVTFGIITLYGGCFLTLHRLGRLAQQRWHLGRPPLRGFLAPAWACLLFASFLTSNSYRWNREGEPRKGLLYARDPRGPSWERFEYERYDAYRRAALFLNSRGAGAPVLISEVGFFGFFYQGNVIDGVGLCSPEALAFYPPPPSDVWNSDGSRTTESNNLVPTRMVFTLWPPYVVNAERYIRNLLQPGSPFLDRYRRVGTSGVAWGSPVGIFRLSR